MLNKNISYIIVVCILVFSFSNKTLAYEFQNKENESLVIDKINQIYDAKQQYEDLAGEYEERDMPTVYSATSDEYWWPIGSSETTKSDGKIYARGEPEATVITSYFGYRDAVYDSNGVQISGGTGHGALDIANMTGPGVTNIIASKSGVVIYPNKGDVTNCPISSSSSSCGGGYGNFIIIQHSDGNYTLYAHLHADTILVKAGESVEQGQVIAKMGSSGNSTGTHLHFEVRNAQNIKLDPLEFVSMEDPRPAVVSDELMKFLEAMEGHTEIIGDEYLVTNIGDGVRTVGAGVTLESNPGRFEKYGINIADYPVGSTIPISIVDQIKIDIVNDNRENIKSMLAENSITLQPHQIDALVSQTYNIGNIVGFVDAYKKYGNTIELYNNWFFRVIDKGGPFEAGLTRRRNAEWKMFHEGIYEY